MSTSTTHRSSTRAYVGVGAAPDDPQFHVRFTPENELSPDTATNSFRWSGWATLHIGARGVLVAARRRGWMGFHRGERRFFPSAEIRNVYRDAGTVRVELFDSPAGKQSFQFWPGDLRAAATIVALLPTSNTVEIDAPTPAETPTPPRRKRAAFWIVGGAAALIGASLIASSVMFLRQAETSLQSAASSATAPAAGSPAPVTQVVRVQMIQDPEAFKGMQEIQRIEPQIEGLKTQFASALTSLELGLISQAQFADGLENWMIPQWRVLGNQLGETTAMAYSLRYAPHAQMSNVISLWQGALQNYASGLREHDTAKNLAAFADMRRAAEIEGDVRHWYGILEQQAAVGVPSSSP
jgi:hypothetical protein